MWKPKRNQTGSDQARIKTLEDRLEAAVAESQRMRQALENVQRPDHPAQPVIPRGRSRATELDTYNPDDTVN